MGHRLLIQGQPVSVTKIAPKEKLEYPAVTRRMAAFIAETADAKLQGDAREILKLSLLDWSAVAIAGMTEPVSQILRAQLSQEAGKTEATVFGQRRRLPARAAALANGATSHALDYDDTHFDYIGHPSVVIFSAALAIAEKIGADGRSFLNAALIGMETACRIGRWLGMGHYQHGFHQTATAGCFGATAACARLLGLNIDQTSHALGLAATRASGLKSQFGTMGKPYNAGIAASNGVEVALLAAQGFISRPDGIECEQGFGDTHVGNALINDAHDLDSIFNGLGETFRFLEVQHKFHACCHGTHPTLEALQKAMVRQPIEMKNIRSVRLVVAPKWLRVCNLSSPATGLEAKFSYKLTSAMMLAGYNTGALSTFSDALCFDPDLIELRDRVNVETDDGLSDTAARVTITLKSGTNIVADHDLDQPISIAEKESKLRAKAEGLVGQKKAKALWNAVDALEAGAVSDFTKLLR
jgi:2-methylcitrate dehydratase PrpD